jgi:hypothetical protein
MQIASLSESLRDSHKSLEIAVSLYSMMMIMGAATNLYFLLCLRGQGLATLLCVGCG